MLHETLVSEPQTDFCVCISLRADNAKAFTEGHSQDSKRCPKKDCLTRPNK